jgi:lipoprotein-anchoring transpeptidase ErfK/SrfK
MRNLVLIAIASLALVACEGNTDRFWFFKNASQQPIAVSTMHAGAFVIWTQDTVQPGEQIQLATTNQMGGVLSPDENPGVPFQFWEIKTLAGDTCTKSRLLSENWTRSVTSLSKVPSNQRHEYIFEVVDTDF